MRVQLIRNIRAIEGNEPVLKNEWEKIQEKGPKSIIKWIDENMSGRSCVVVLVGEKTSERRWVMYEIKKAWEDGKGLLGIYIHNIKCPRNGKSRKGENPFDLHEDGRIRSSVVECHDPDPKDAYNDISNNIEKWIEDAIAQRTKELK
jgi:hypothetical protein